MANSNSDHVVAAKRILVADPIHEQGRAFLTARPGLTVDVVAGLDEAVSFRAYQLAGGPASDTVPIHFRAITTKEISWVAGCSMYRVSVAAIRRIMDGPRESGCFDT